jgi:hypothetical protein
MALQFVIICGLHSTAKSKQLLSGHRERPRSDIWYMGQPFPQLLELDFASDKVFLVDSRGAAQSQAQIVVWCHTFASSRVRRLHTAVMSKPGQ